MTVQRMDTFGQQEYVAAALHLHLNVIGNRRYIANVLIFAAAALDSKLVSVDCLNCFVDDAYVGLRLI